MHVPQPLSSANTGRMHIYCNMTVMICIAIGVGLSPGRKAERRYHLIQAARIQSRQTCRLHAHLYVKVSWMSPATSSCVRLQQDRTTRVQFQKKKAAFPVSQSLSQILVTCSVVNGINGLLVHNNGAVEDGMLMFADITQ